jgi:hypothetical protein
VDMTPADLDLDPDYDDDYDDEDWALINNQVVHATDQKAQ